MSDTPRTDAITPMVTPDMMRRMRDLARELERENAELRKERDRYAQQAGECSGGYETLEKEVAELRQRLEAAEKDAARYRWIKSRKSLVLRSVDGIWTRADGSKFTATHYLAESYKQHAPTPDLDETIDAAMQEK